MTCKLLFSSTVASLIFAGVKATTSMPWDFSRLSVFALFPTSSGSLSTTLTCAVSVLQSPHTRTHCRSLIFISSLCDLRPLSSIQPSLQRHDQLCWLLVGLTCRWHLELQVHQQLALHSLLARTPRGWWLQLRSIQGLLDWVWILQRSHQLLRASKHSWLHLQEHYFGLLDSLPMQY